jgi:hypothetical protein
MFTAAEKALIQKVFLMWANAVLNGYMHPSPVGVVNDATQLLPGDAFVQTSCARGLLCIEQHTSGNRRSWLFARAAEFFVTAALMPVPAPLGLFSFSRPLKKRTTQCPVAEPGLNCNIGILT